MRWSFGIAALSLVFVVSAKSQDTLVGAGKINGYTGVVFDTRDWHYDYLVDSSLKEDDPAAHRYRTVQAAYAAAPAGEPGKPTVIGIKPDVYHLPGTSAETGLAITKNNITLLGLTDDRRKVVLADNRGNQEGAANNGFTMTVSADGFSAINLTVMNYCNMDYDYPGDASKSLKKRSDVITQAVAAQLDGDRHYYSHVAFLSRLDTLFVRTKRSYFTNAYVEGTDDFIGGGDIGIWKDSEVWFAIGNGVMFSTGITFIDTVFKATNGMEFYKVMRLPVTLIDCTLPTPRKDAPIAWFAWKTAERANYLSTMYGTKDTSGKTPDIIDSLIGPVRHNYGRVLTADEARAFNPWNLLHATADGKVNDGWDPAGVRAKYENEKSRVFRMALTNANSTIRTGQAGVTIGASVLPVDAPDKTIRWSTDSKLVTLRANEGASVTVTGSNTLERAEDVAVKATAANGFYALAWVHVEPAFIAPPAFVKKAVLGAPEHGVMRVAYALDLGHKQDESVITWFLCSDATCATERKVAVSRGGEPLRQLTLGEAAIGKYVKATIAPKHNISEAGAVVTVISAKPVAAHDVVTNKVDPDFRNFVETENKEYAGGEWTVLGTWTSVADDALVNGYGIRIGSAGAALLYQNDEPVGDMTATIVMNPEKTQGQGFGLPGKPDDSTERNQRADLFFKYDPRTKNGYSLRFWRTNDSAVKVMFQLYKIVNGHGTPLSDQKELTGVFKPQTTIVISVVGSKVTVTGHNTVDKETLSLEGTIEPNQFGGAGAFWSGSVPLGNSVIFSKFALAYAGK